MNNRIVLVSTGILLIVSFAITASNNHLWPISQQAAAQPQPSSAAGGPLTYTDPICAIRIQYPPNWEATGLGSGGAQFSVPRINDSFSISISPFSSSSLGSAPSLEGHARDFIDLLRKDLGQNFQLINSGKTTLAGNPALSIEYRFRDVGGFGLGLPAASQQQAEVKRTLDIFTTKGDKLYTLSYSTPEAEYPRYLPAINSMISTFAIGNPSSACRPENAFLSLGGGLGGGLGVDPFGGELDESIGGIPLSGPPLDPTAPGNDLGGGAVVPATPGGGGVGVGPAPGGTVGNLPTQSQQQPPSVEQPQGIPTQE